MWWVSLAWSAGLTLHPVETPVLHNGKYRFAEATELTVLPAVVVTLRAGAVAPPGAVPLGGRSWRIPTSSPESALLLAFQLKADEGVASVWPDVILPIRTLQFDDPSYGGQWYLEELDMESLFSVTLGDPTVRVAVIDSGIDLAHEDLVEAYEQPYDAWSDDDDPSPNPGEYCSQGTAICDEHGTAVSGIVAARSNNGVGIVGMCSECTLIPLKLLGEGDGNTLSADVAAFEHAIAADVAVINNSWGFIDPIAVPEPLAEVIHRAATEPRDGKGALVVFAAGNDDREIEDDELQALDDVLCVSATDSYGQPTAYTNFGDSVDVAAPSATVTIAPNQSIITNFGGTSAAAPVVSGLAAWAMSVDPDLTAQELADLLIETAVPSPLVVADEQGHHPLYGYGEIDALALKERLIAPAEEEEPQGCACANAGMEGGTLAWAMAAVAGVAARSGARRRQKTV